MKATSDRNVEVYCGECGGNLVVHADVFTLAHDVSCKKCGNCTPLFRRRIDALKYYKKEYGMTYEYTD